MARAKNESSPVEEVKVEVEETPVEEVAGDNSERQNEPRQDYVTREDFDNAVKFLQNAISQLKEQVSDLETVVTAPQGAVEWIEVGRPEASQEDDTPEYVAGERAPSDLDSTPWY